MQDKYEKYLQLEDTRKFFEEQKRKAELSLREVKADIVSLENEIRGYFKANGLVNDVVKHGDFNLEFKLTKPRGKMVIDDPEALPDEYVSYEAKVDKKGLGEFLKGKNLMEYGVSYEYSEPSVTWRVVK